MSDDDDRIWTNAMMLAERDKEIDALEAKLARADARIAELVELVDGAEDIVEIFAAESPSQIAWKRQWLERARKAVREHCNGG